jgi:hypothetical protein
MVKEVRSPWSHEGGRATGANRPIGQSPISTPRADGGHLSRFTGKGAISPKLLRRGDDGDHVFQRSNASFPLGGDNRFKGSR